MGKILEVNYEKKYLKSGIGIALLLTFGKLLGFAKHLIVSWYFGTNKETDIYFMAEGLVAAVNNMVFSAFSIAFLRMYVENKKKNSKEESEHFVSNTLILGFGIAFFISVSFNILSNLISKLIAPLYDNNSLDLLAQFLRYLSPIFILCCFINLLGGILDGENYFVHSRLFGLISSICYIIITVVLGRKFGPKVLVYANLLGYILFLIYLLIILCRLTIKSQVKNGNFLNELL